jgi:hypothetical protein
MFPILSFRKDPTHIKKPLNILDISLLPSNDDLLITLVENATLTNANYVQNGGYVQYDVSATAMTGGTPKVSFYLRGGNNDAVNFNNSAIFQAKNFDLGCSYDGAASDWLTIGAQSISGNATLLASINIREYT